MKTDSRSKACRRTGVSVIVGTMLLQTVFPAHAVSPGYAGYVSQLPGIYVSPPDVNVMFTLDDSGSMRDETIPDNNVVTDTMWSGGWISNATVTFSVATADQQRQKYLLSNSTTSQTWRYYRSSAGNPIYYNPSTRYTPWQYAGNDALTYPNANYNAACYYPDTLPVATSPIPLPASPAAPACVLPNITNLAARVDVSGGTGAADDQTKNYWPATYFNYVVPGPLLANGQANQTANPAGTLTNWQKVEIKPSVTSYPKAATRTDCAGVTCTYTEELQNFANWFQYYRSRALMAKGAVGQAFSRQGTNLRPGFATLHGSATTIDGASTPLIKRGVRQFQGNDRQRFYTRLYGTATVTGTPLRSAADWVGRYFQRSGPGSPWAEDPSNLTSAGTEHACRRSFHILTSDGYWNDISEIANGPLTSVGNADNFTGYVAPYNNLTNTAGTTFSNTNAERLAIDPFADSYSNTLSDYAAWYWKRDLRPDLPNVVKPTARDPAYWQHLTTYTVGIGVSNGTASITTQAQRDTLIANKAMVPWGNAYNGAANSVLGDDFVHASMTGRGRFFLALNPTEFATDLATALAEVSSQPGDLAAVSTDAPQLRIGGRVYQGTFNPDKWHGRLYAFDQDATTGAVNNKPTDSSYTNPFQAWEASNKLPTPGARNIYTFDGIAKAGRPFQVSGLNPTQLGQLGSNSAEQAMVLDYLRGSPKDEIANGGLLRNRSRYTLGATTGGVLGDIVNSSPVKGPDFGVSYDQLPIGPAQAAYAAFRSGTGLDNMRNSLYVGANDGMLHAFDIADGVERFAYVPNAVYEVPRSSPSGAAEKKLKMLSEPSYPHRFTVDGPPNLADAYLNGAWKTVLAGSTGAGARAVFALNVTNPAVGGAGGFDETKLMWEFTDADHPDMGFVVGYPHIARMRDGTWVAMFGNGYDSTNGQAKLFLLNLETGLVHKEFAVGAPGNNGLSQPNFVLNSSREVIAIYAGDLRGNLWKFNVDDVNPAGWSVAFGGAPLFRAVNASGQEQPITVMPAIVQHSSQAGPMIMFGTGRLFERDDTAATNPPNVNLRIQSLYGIWDKPGEVSGITGARATVLKVHTVDAAVTPPPGYGATTSGEPSWPAQRGWYLDLNSGGERVNIVPQRVGRVVFMVANTPVADPCRSGGTARLFVLDPTSGATPSFAVFDTDANGSFAGEPAGINVRLSDNGVLTRPLFQLTAGVGSPVVGTGVSPSMPSQFYEGQTSSVQPGGVELARTTNQGPCQALMTAAKSDTSLSTSLVNLCGGKPRVSWRQLK